MGYLNTETPTTADHRPSPKNKVYWTVKGYWNVRCNMLFFCSWKPWKCHNTEKWISFLFPVVCLAAPITLPTARACYSTDFRSVNSAKNTIKSLNFTSGQITLIRGVTVVLGDNYKFLRSSLRNFLPAPVSYLPQCPVLTPSALLPTRRKTKLEMLHHHKKKPAMFKAGYPDERLEMTVCKPNSSI